MELLALHVPPETGWLSVIEEPTHTCDGPVMAGGAADTVTTVLTVQLVGKVKTIVAVPTAPPVIAPVAPTTEAMPGALLVHVPPAGVLLSIVVVPTQIEVLPVMVVGSGLTFTVTVLVVVQPAKLVAVML